MFHLFIAFVVIVVMIRLGFGPIFAKILRGLAVIAIVIAGVIAVISMIVNLVGDLSHAAHSQTLQAERTDASLPYCTPGYYGPTCQQRPCVNDAPIAYDQGNDPLYRGLQILYQTCPKKTPEAAPPPAERTDVYQQSLQILSGENLTPLN